MPDTDEIGLSISEAAMPTPPNAPVTPKPDLSKPVSPPPAKPGDETPRSPIADAFDELDKYSKEDSGDIPPATKSPKQKSLEKKPATEDKKPDDEPPKPDQEAPKPADQPAKPKKPADFLRDELTKVKTERDSLRSELEKARTSKPAEDPEKLTLSEELKKTREAHQKLQEEIKYLDYSRSEEFQEKYYKPFVQAFEKGRAKVSSLTVTDENGDRRKATAEDFDKIMQLRDDEAAELAAQMFGEAAGSIVMWHRERVLEANDAQSAALEEFRKTNTDRQKQINERKLEETKKANTLWTEYNKQAAEKFPKIFQPIEGDDKGNELLKKGFEKADFAFNLPPDMPLEQVVAIHSAIRNKAAAFGRLVYQNTQKDARIAELEKQLEQFKASEPGPGEGDSEGGTVKPADNMEGALAGLDKVAK